MTHRRHQPVGQRAKIVATLGPATDSPEMIPALIRAGVDVFRLNFSHGERSEHARHIGRIRAAAKRMNRAVAIMQDLQGPKIRTGPLVSSNPVQLKDRAAIVITTRQMRGTAERISTSYNKLPKEVHTDDMLLISDGRLVLRVESTTATEVHCVVEQGGELRERQGISVPGASFSLPSLTRKDQDDLRFGLAQGVDFVAMSFVRKPEDIMHTRAFMKRQGRIVPIVTKVETREAIEHLEDIVNASDAVMVARGDLGVEVGPEQVPVLQKRMVHQCRILGIPCIIATQMLESLMEDPMPSRAEVSDIANAAWEGADALMLSGETAVGKHPIEAVETMARIIAEAESSVGPLGLLQPVAVLDPSHSDEARALSNAAEMLVDDLGIRAIAGMTRTGRLAQLLSAQRPAVPIYAFTPDADVYIRLVLRWGVTPFPCTVEESAEAMLAQMDGELLRRHLASPGERILVVGSMPLLEGVHTNFLKVHHVEKH